MGHDTVTTKDALIETAGELFADVGLEGTSIRAIAEKCKVNIAAVNYHFGSKENLYLEVVRHVMLQVRCSLAGKYLAKREEWEHDPLMCAEVIYRLVEERLRQFFPGMHPGWYGRMFMRILLSPTPPMWELAREIILPDYEQLHEVFRCCRPGMSAEESELWADSLIGQLCHYVFSEQFIELIPDRECDQSGFQERVLRHIARMLIKGLDLPLPKMLNEGERYA